MATIKEAEPKDEKVKASNKKVKAEDRLRMQGSALERNESEKNEFMKSFNNQKVRYQVTESAAILSSMSPSAYSLTALHQKDLPESATNTIPSQPRTSGSGDNYPPQSFLSFSQPTGETSSLIQNQIFYERNKPLHFGSPAIVNDSQKQPEDVYRLPVGKKGSQLAAEGLIYMGGDAKADTITPNHSSTVQLKQRKQEIQMTPPINTTHNGPPAFPAVAESTYQLVKRMNNMIAIQRANSRVGSRDFRTRSQIDNQSSQKRKRLGADDFISSSSNGAGQTLRIAIPPNIPISSHGTPTVELGSSPLYYPNNVVQHMIHKVDPALYVYQAQQRKKRVVAGLMQLKQKNFPLISVLQKQQRPSNSGSNQKAKVYCNDVDCNADFLQEHDYESITPINIRSHSQSPSKIPSSQPQQQSFIHSRSVTGLNHAQPDQITAAIMSLEKSISQITDCQNNMKALGRNSEQALKAQKSTLENKSFGTLIKGQNQDNATWVPFSQSETQGQQEEEYQFIRQTSKVGCFTLTKIDSVQQRNFTPNYKTNDGKRNKIQMRQYESPINIVGLNPSNPVLPKLQDQLSKDQTLTPQNKNSKKQVKVQNRQGGWPKQKGFNNHEDALTAHQQYDILPVESAQGSTPVLTPQKANGLNTRNASSKKFQIMQSESKPKKIEEMRVMPMKLTPITRVQKVNNSLLKSVDVKSFSPIEKQPNQNSLQISYSKNNSKANNFSGQNPAASLVMNVDSTELTSCLIPSKNNNMPEFPNQDPEDLTVQNMYPYEELDKKMVVSSHISFNSFKDENMVVRQHNSDGEQQRLSKEQLFRMSKKNIELYAQNVLNDMVREKPSRTMLEKSDAGKIFAGQEASPGINSFSKLMNQMFDKGASSPVAVREHQQFPQIMHANERPSQIEENHNVKNIIQSSSPVIEGARRYLKVTGSRSPFQFNSHQQSFASALKMANSNYFSMNLKKINGLDNDFVENRAWSLGPPIMSKQDSNYLSIPNRSIDEQFMPNLSVKNFSFLTRNHKMMQSGQPEVVQVDDNYADDDVYNFIKKAASLKLDFGSLKGSEISHPNASVIDQPFFSKKKNFMRKSADKDQSEIDRLQHQPQYYNFGKAKPVLKNNAAGSSQSFLVQHKMISQTLNNSHSQIATLNTGSLMPPISKPCLNNNPLSTVTFNTTINHNNMGASGSFQDINLFLANANQGTNDKKNYQQYQQQPFKPPLNVYRQMQAQQNSKSGSKKTQEQQTSQVAQDLEEHGQQQPEELSISRVINNRGLAGKHSKLQANNKISSLIDSPQKGRKLIFNEDAPQENTKKTLQGLEQKESRNPKQQLTQLKLKKQQAINLTIQPSLQVSPPQLAKLKNAQQQQRPGTNQSPTKLQKDSSSLSLIKQVIPTNGQTPSPVKQRESENTQGGSTINDSPSQSQLPLPTSSQQSKRPALFIMLEKQLMEAKLKPQPVLVDLIENVMKKSIKIVHREDGRMKSLMAQNRIQKALDISNTLLRLANKSTLPMQQIQSLPQSAVFNKFELQCLRKANMQIPKNKDLAQFIRSRDFYATAREKASIILTAELQQSVNMPGTKPNADIGQGGVPGFYTKFFVGYGNNYPLVKQILKYRWWLALGDQCNFEDSSLVWTSWKKQKIINKLSTYDEYITSHAPYSKEKIMGQHKIPVKKLYGRMEDNFHLANKKGLLMNLKEYYRLKNKCVFEAKVFPQTYLIRSNDYFGTDDMRALKKFASENPNAYWIVKPGEDSNRGCGITLCDNEKELLKLIKTELTHENIIQRNCEIDSPRSGGYLANGYNSKTNINHYTGTKTLIVQSYIKNPLLINKRKFDIRVYGMLVTHFGVLRGYFFEEGYLRTSSKEFTLENFSNKYIHLTNDAIQKYSEDYGKFESGNKLNYAEFQKYLESPEFLASTKYSSTIKFYRDILPQIRHLVTDSFRSVAYKRIDPNRRVNSFEIFGFDFMIDEDFTVYLIEANTNPCLEINGCHVLARIIPHMLDCAFRIAVDPILPPPDWAFKKGLEQVQENKFSLVYDDRVELSELKQLYDKDQEAAQRRDFNFTELREEEEKMEEDQQRQNEENQEEEDLQHIDIIADGNKGLDVDTSKNEEGGGADQSSQGEGEDMFETE